MEVITIEGRLGQNASVKQSQNGTQFLTFNVATNKVSRGERKTNWYEVMSFNPQHMGKLKDYLTKGSDVIVVGELDPSAQIGKDGKVYLRLSVIADRITFTSGSNSGNTQTTVTTTTPDVAMVTSAPSDNITMESSVPVNDPLTSGGNVADNNDLPF